MVRAKSSRVYTHMEASQSTRTTFCTAAQLPEFVFTSSPTEAAALSSKAPAALGISLAKLYTANRVKLEERIRLSA